MSFSLRRRQFLKSFCLLFLSVIGCEKEKKNSERRVTIPIDSLEEGVNPQPLYGLAILQDEKGLRASTLFCTHQTCMLNPAPAAGSLFVCPCHGSRFGEDGKPQQGPATKPLDFYRISRTEQNDLLIHLNETVSPEWRLPHESL